MAKLQQGEEYEEDYGFKETEAEYDEEAELEIDTFYGVPKKVVYIGAAVVLVVVIAVFLFMSYGKSDSVTGDYTDDMIETTEYEIDPDPIVDGSTMYSPEPMEGVVEYVPPAEGVIIDPYSDTQKEELRRLGYTGDEIEIALENGFSYDALVEHATQLRNAEAEEALKRMSDTASDEFKTILYYSYLGQGETWNPQGEREGITESRSSIKVNADYVKCPTYGNQLLLKCKIADNAYVWYNISPVRWLSLPPEGNIVLNVDFWSMNGNAYVVNISEADSALNSVDSSHSYDDISDGEVNNDNEETDNDEEVVDEEPSFITD